MLPQKFSAATIRTAPEPRRFAVAPQPAAESAARTASIGSSSQLRRSTGSPYHEMGLSLILVMSICALVLVRDGIDRLE